MTQLSHSPGKHYLSACFTAHLRRSSGVNLRLEGNRHQVKENRDPGQFELAPWYLRRRTRLQRLSKPPTLRPLYFATAIVNEESGVMIVLGFPTAATIDPPTIISLPGIGCHRDLCRTIHLCNLRERASLSAKSAVDDFEAINTCNE